MQVQQKGHPTVPGAQSTQRRPKIAASSHVVHAWKLPDLRELLAPKTAGGRKGVQVPEAATRLLDLLVQAQQEGRQRTVARQDVDALLDELAALNMPFNLQDLSGGPGVVSYTRGVVALWDALQRPSLASSRRPNRASQDLDADQRSVINKAEFWGPQVYVTASGTFKPLIEEEQGSGLRCPVPVEASIQKGVLHWGDFELPLPIKGTGRFEVVYCDKNLRIFRSNGSWSVQVRESLLP